jgi:Ni,Fe-hydrogenase I large subunit
VVINGHFQTLDTGKIGEYVGYSRYSSSSGLHPFEGQTTPDSAKAIVG